MKIDCSSRCCPALLRFSLITMVVFLAFAGRATTNYVTSLADNGPGTLRDRISVAAPGDTINFNLNGTITLNSQLTIFTNLTINGVNPTLLKVSANKTGRVFNIAGGTVQISGITISDGLLTGTNGTTGHNGQNEYGGGIIVSNGAGLVLTGCIVSNNVAIGGQAGSGAFGGNAYGGAIGSLGGLAMISCLVVSNSATGGAGGAFDGAGQAWGGALYEEGYDTIQLSTFYANVATGGGGGGGNGTGAGGAIYNVGTVILYSSTIVTNTSTGPGPDEGGGIDDFGTLTIRDCTIVGNRSDVGGGITGGDIGNTILAGNSAGTDPDGDGFITSSDYNLIQNTTGMTISGTTTHNMTGTNPLLGPLRDNGDANVSFAMPTLAPLPGSPVIDKGNSFLTTDERGLARPYDTPLPNAAGGNGGDIGAVEIRAGTFLVVNKNDSGAGSFRQALLDNNGYGGGNTIEFSNTVTGAITLSNGELVVLYSATIDGPGANLLAISGNHSGRVLNVGGGTVSITGITIRDGLLTGTNGTTGHNGQNEYGAGIIVSNGASLSLYASIVSNNVAVGGQAGSGASGGNAYGGAIANLGTLAVLDSLVVSNTATGGAGGAFDGGGQAWGGALYADGSVTIQLSTFYANVATGGGGGGGNGTGAGGGIYTVGTIGINASTIVSNTATGPGPDEGGGIDDFGTLTISDCTIVGNRSDVGGGITGGDIGNTILAGNSAGTGPDGTGFITSSDYNLIQNTNSMTISGTTTHNITGTNPLLGPLRDNGEAYVSFAMPTLAPLPGSPVIDKGNNFDNPDERGFNRPYDLISVPNAAGGNGGDIGALEFLPTPLLTIQRAINANVVLSWTTDAADYTLQYATNLPAANTWSNVNSAVVTIGSLVYVTNSVTGGTRFYRLYYPEAALPP